MAYTAEQKLVVAHELARSGGNVRAALHRLRGEYETLRSLGDATVRRMLREEGFAELVAQRAAIIAEGERRAAAEGEQARRLAEIKGSLMERLARDELLLDEARAHGSGHQDLGRTGHGGVLRAAPAHRGPAQGIEHTGGRADRRSHSAGRSAAGYAGCQVRPGECYFEDSIIEILRAGCMRPSEVIWQGRLRIYQRPAPGRVYKIGADVAEGLADGDASSAHVIDQLSGVVAAKYKGRIGLTEYAQDLVALAKLYNNAWLAIEANNHGHAVCAWAYQHCRYRRVYRESREEEGQLQGPARYRLGILNTAATKPMMLAELDDGFRKGAIKVHDAETVEELASFLRLPGGGGRQRCRGDLRHDG